MFRAIGLFVWVSAIVTTGCDGGKGKPPTHTVSGKVTLDGKPMPEGIIFFEANPPDGQAPANAPISNGEYSAEVPAGSKLVRISHEKMVKSPMGGDEVEIPTQMVPPRYNSQSTLTREVTEGANSFDFEIQSR